MPIADEIKDSFKKGTTLIRLIYINIGVFIAFNLIKLLFFLFNMPGGGSRFIMNWFAVPSDLSVLIIKPWTLITYMFLHEGFFHILFNMIWLWVFGRVFLEYWDSKKLRGVYILGGLAGAGFYILAFNVFPVFQNVVGASQALGASAAAMAIAVAISVYRPNYTLYLMFLGPVKIKYIALFFVGIDILTLSSGNAGGHLAHLGGAFFGYIFANTYLKKSTDLTRSTNNFIDQILAFFTNKSRMHVHYKKSAKDMDDMQYNKEKAKHQKNIDEILDKIAKYGYESLTKQEKEQLFRMRKP